MQGDLGARLSQAGVITRDQLRAALASAPLHEGDLTKALVESGVPEEELLNFFVHEGFGPVVTAEELAKFDPAMLGRLPGSMAHALLALPLRGDSSGFIVAMAAPSDAHSVGELGRTLGGPVVPVVASISSLREAIGIAYPDDTARISAESEPPVLELVQRRTREWEKLPPTRQANPKTVPRLWVEWEEDVESDEPPLLLVRTKSRDHAPPGSTTRGSEHIVSKSFGRPEGSIPPRAEAEVFDDHRGTADYVALPGSVPPPNPADQERWDTPPSVTPPKIPSARAGPKFSSHPAPPTSSADFEARVTAIHLASNRDEVIGLACDAAMTVARSTVFLVLRKGALEGFDARGEALSGPAIRELVIPTSSPSKFRQVTESREPYHGPYGTTIVDGIFRAAVASPGINLSLHPVLVLDKVVGVLCADDMTDLELGIPRLELLAKAVGEAFRRLLTHRK